MVLGLAIALGLSSVAAEEPRLHWLEGRWCTEAAKGRFTCEDWQPMVDGVMPGVTTIYSSPRTVDAEPMRIVLRDGKLVFHAEPAGQAPTDFYAVAMPAGQTVRFENRAHDYPQVVRYWREGDVLNAEISLADGSKAKSWKYQLYRSIKQ